MNDVVTNYDMTTAPCDVCGRRGPCALHLNPRGEAVSTTCAMCDRYAWEAAGDEAKDKWLEGGTPRLHRPD